MVVSVQEIWTLTSFAPGLAVRLDTVQRPLGVVGPGGCALTPFTVTWKLLETASSSSSIVPQNTSTLAPKRHSGGFAATGSGPKYASPTPQPGVSSTSRTRGATPSSQTRICESRWKQSANFAAINAAQDWLRSTESVLASRTSMPTGRYGCWQLL